MSQPYVGQIVIAAFTFAPQGWLLCDGSVYSISEYEVLFNLLGTTYGGDGQTTFAVPDLRGRIPVHVGQGSGLQSYVIGEQGGQSSVTLTPSQIPAHTHPVACQSNAGTSTAATGNYFAQTKNSLYGTPGTTVNMGSVVGPAGGNQAHDNMQPYQVLNYIIAFTGIFPSQN
jgi:microcystin-dependent protein